MQIQLNTDRNIEGGAGLTSMVEATLEDKLSRFRNRITRLEVHLSDENSSRKAGDDDKRCVIEARLGGLEPVTVSSNAPAIDLAVETAADKLKITLDRRLGKLSNTKGGTSASGDAPL